MGASGHVLDILQRQVLSEQIRDHPDADGVGQEDVLTTDVLERTAAGVMAAQRDHEKDNGRPANLSSGDANRARADLSCAVRWIDTAVARSRIPRSPKSCSASAGLSEPRIGIPTDLAFWVQRYGPATGSPVSARPSRRRHESSQPTRSWRVDAWLQIWDTDGLGAGLVHRGQLFPRRESHNEQREWPGFRHGKRPSSAAAPRSERSDRSAEETRERGSNRTSSPCWAGRLQ